MSPVVERLHDEAELSAKLGSGSGYLYAAGVFTV